MSIFRDEQNSKFKKKKKNVITCNKKSNIVRSIKNMGKNSKSKKK